MKINEAIEIALNAYDEDDAEREAILDALLPTLLTRKLLRDAIADAWKVGRCEAVSAALAEYQAERARIDAEIRDVRAVRDSLGTGGVKLKGQGGR